MLRRPSQNWRSCIHSISSCKVLLAYIVTNFLFAKVFHSVPCIYYKPMKRNFVVWSVPSLSSWWQQPLGKTYGLRCQNRVMVSDSFVFRKTKSCTQHSFLVLRFDVGDLSAFVTESRGSSREWSKIIHNRTLHETLRQNRPYYTNVLVGNRNSNYLNILMSESERQLDLQLDSQVLALWNTRTSVER